MEKYVHTQTLRSSEESVQPNEVRITTLGRRKNYISYTIGKLSGDNALRSVVLRAMGRAMSKAVMVAEIVKHRVANLHQLTTVDSVTITEVYEPKEEGLKQVQIQKKVPTIQIVLSFDQLDTNATGYQAPLPADQVTPERPEGPASNNRRGGRGGRGRGGRGRGRGGRGRGRGGRGAATAVANGEVNGEQAQVQSSEDSGRGRGRGGRGRGRGGRGGRGRGRGGRGRGRGRGAPAQTPQ